MALSTQASKKSTRESRAGREGGVVGDFSCSDSGEDRRQRDLDPGGTWSPMAACDSGQGSLHPSTPGLATTEGMNGSEAPCWTLSCRLRERRGHPQVSALWIHRTQALGNPPAGERAEHRPRENRLPVTHRERRGWRQAKVARQLPSTQAPRHPCAPRPRDRHRLDLRVTRDTA